jgi:hypothetical protein
MITEQDRKKRTSCNLAVYLDKQSVAIEVREAQHPSGSAPCLESTSGPEPHRWG